jgi:hypothetical protein
LETHQPLDGNKNVINLETKLKELQNKQILFLKKDGTGKWKKIWNSGNLWWKFLI